MSKTSIHIERLQIAGLGISPPVAQTAARSLGEDLLAGLGRQNWTSHQPISLNRLDLGTLSVKNPHDARQIRQAIASAILEAIVQKTGVGGQQP